MKKIFSFIAVLSLFAFIVFPVSAKVERVVETVDSFDVPAYSADMTPDVVSSVSLEDGVEYLVTVSGTASAGDSIIFDAECSDKTNMLPDGWTDYVQGYVSYGEQLLDLFMDGNHDWGTCAENHVYTKTVIGDGTPLDFYINDIYPINNSGYLHVEITREWKNHGQYVKSQEAKQEAAHSRVGMPKQSMGHVEKE